MKTWGKYIKPYLAYFILGPLCMIVEVVGEVLMPLYLAEVINGAIVGTLTVGGGVRKLCRRSPKRSVPQGSAFQLRKY